MSSEGASVELSSYRDQHFKGTRYEQEKLLKQSCCLYVGNLAFYTTEEQIYELFSRCGDIKRIVMGLDKYKKVSLRCLQHRETFCDEIKFFRLRAVFASSIITFERIPSQQCDTSTEHDWMIASCESIGMPDSSKDVNTDEESRADKFEMNTDRTLMEAAAATGRLHTSQRSRKSCRRTRTCFTL